MAWFKKQSYPKSEERINLKPAFYLLFLVVRRFVVLFGIIKSFSTQYIIILNFFLVFLSQFFKVDIPNCCKKTSKNCYCIINLCFANF